MGLLDRLLGKKQEERPPPELDLRELDDWVAEKIEERKRELVEDLTPAVDEILKSRDMVEEVVRDLEEYEFPPELKKKVFKPVLTSKPAYVKGMADALRGMGPSNPETHEDLRDFYAAVRKAMKTIEKVQLGKGRYLMVTFREYMLKIGGSLNTILDYLKAMKEELEEAEKEIQRMENLAAEAAELRKKLDFINAPAVRGGETKELQKKKEQLERELREFLEGEEYRRFIELEEKLEKLEQAEGSLRMRVINIIGPFRRSFRKLRKLMEDEEEYRIRKALDDYLDTPFEAFTAEDESCRGIKAILVCLRRAVEEGTLKLRRKERGKIMSMVAVSAEKLVELRAGFQRIREEKAEVAKEFEGSVAPEIKKNLERELAVIQGELERLEEEGRSRVEEVERLKAEVPGAIARLEEKIQEFTGEKIRLRKPFLEG